MAEEQTVPGEAEAVEAALIPDHEVVDSGVNADAMLNDLIARQFGEAQPSADVPHPEEPSDPPVEEQDEDLEVEEESAVSTDDDDVEEVVDDVEASGDDTSTEADTYTMDDLDDFQLTHKIDGEPVTMALSEWIKGAATQQHLSKQGRELGDLKKEIEAERNERLQEINRVAEALNEELQVPERKLAKEYHELKEKLETAEAEGDDYEVQSLTTKQQRVHQKYWDARRKREDQIKKVDELRAQREAEQRAEEVKFFQDNIKEYVPDWTDERGPQIAEWAMSEGIPGEILETVTSPVLVAFLDKAEKNAKELASIKSTRTKGAVKRKAVPAKKAVPTKKAKAPAEVAVDRRKTAMSKIETGQASMDEVDDLLTDMVKNTLNI